MHVIDLGSRFDYGSCRLLPGNQQKPAHPGDKSPERLALNSPFHIPLRRTSCVPPVWPHIKLEAFSMVGGGFVTSAQISHAEELSRRWERKIRFETREASKRRIQ